MAANGSKPELPRTTHRRQRFARSTGTTKSSPSPGHPLTVVGIGASAGGLDPCRRFFTEMPSDSGMAFILIQHLDPVHKSETASLLGRCTKMAVREAWNGARVEPNHVYVIPPNRALAIHKGQLRLSEPVEAHGRRLPVDFFFRSLADDCAERGIGIIFSGTGSDGALGLGAIRAAGGLSIAQDPQMAEHDGMPRSAIAGGVDFVLAVNEMPEVLIKYAKHPYVQWSGRQAVMSADGRDKYHNVLGLLRARTKFDFGSYKHGTIQRRVQRRMSLRHMVRIEKYLELLRNDADEVAALLKDLLISVTRFFREPEAWKVLQEEIIRRLIAAKSDDQSLRVWAPGCATGEEAYSIGMVLFDELRAAGKNCPVQIFASDVNREAFAAARLGLYPENISVDVPPQRLQRYFLREGIHYRVRKELRDAVVFAEHNLLADPPFSHLDLITCRNLLIYLDPPAQKKAIALFHYALGQGGCLFLGSAETVGERHDLYRPISRKWRLYRRIGPARSEPVEIPIDRKSVPSPPRLPAPAPPVAGTRFTELAQQLILDRYAPACVVINSKHEILYTCGPTQTFLQQPAGVMLTDLLAWVAQSLRSKLRGALNKVQTNEQAITLAGLRIRRGSSTTVADITLEPLKSPRQADGLILLRFRETSSPAPAPAPSTIPSAADEESTVVQLEDELKTTRDDLQTNIDQLAASNEELKASNEEVTSVNEELQSTNEELETSKEELQSLNEELSTVNNQLQAKVEELESRTNDLNNLLSSTDIATIFLDRQFHIKWFSPSTTQLLRLRPSDIGRPLGDFAQKFTGEDLLSDAVKVLHKSTPVEREIRGQDGNWYLRRTLPYHTGDNHIDGVVINFVNVHRIKIAEEGVRRLATVLRDSNDAVTLQDFDGHMLAWNRGAQKMLGYSETEALHFNAMKIVPLSQQARLRTIIHEFKLGQRATASAESQRVCKDGRIIDVWVTITALLDEQGQPMGIATTKRDITQHKRAEAALRELNQNLEKRVAERTAIAEDQSLRLREMAAQLLATEEQERQKLAAELHDNLVQMLHVAKMKLSELIGVSRTPEQQALFQEVEQLLGRANQSARSLSYQLSPPVLHELGLIPALEWLGEEMKRNYKLEVKIEDDRRAKKIDDRTRVILFRAVRELLVNVSKHAGVQRARVRICRKDAELIITVEDYGVGFDPQAAYDPKKTHGLGLFSIREHLEYMGGSMKIKSAVGKKRRTTVTLTMPLVGQKRLLAEGRS